MTASDPSPTRLYHNTRCSKSRAALDLLHARGIEPELVYYLETPPGAGQLHRRKTSSSPPPEDCRTIGAMSVIRMSVG